MRPLSQRTRCSFDPRRLNTVQRLCGPSKTLLYRTPRSSCTRSREFRTPWQLTSRSCSRTNLRRLDEAITSIAQLCSDELTAVREVLCSDLIVFDCSSLVVAHEPRPFHEVSRRRTDDNSAHLSDFRQVAFAIATHSILSSPGRRTARIRSHIPFRLWTSRLHRGHSRHSCPGALARRNMCSRSKAHPWSARRPETDAEMSVGC